MLSGGIKIPDGADLNNYTTPGNYYCPKDVSIPTLKNCPLNHAFILKVRLSTGEAYPSQEIIEFNTGKKAYRVLYLDNVWQDWIFYVTNTDLGGAVFQPASGNIKYGMNGIYIGAFSNGPLQSDGTAFEACIYLIATKGWLTVAYVFPITQYSEGHLFFNRMNHNNAWELSSWKKLIA